MDAEHSHHRSAEPDSAQRTGLAEVERAPANELLASVASGLPANSLLDHPEIGSRGNAPVQAAVLQRAQRTYGNRAVQRYLHGRREAADAAPTAAAGTLPAVQRDGDGGTATATPPATPAPAATPTNAPAVATPTEEYVVPFDRNPLSLPGEEVLFNDVFRHADPTLFQLVYTGTGGKFDSAAGSASKTIAGLNSGNLPFFVDSAWNGTSAVSVQLQVERLADHVNVRSYTWTFAKKVNIPTTITQQETEGERDLPGVYSYKLGPDIGNDGRADYVHETVLETFGARSCNITMAELKPDWRTAHPGVTNDAQITAHFFGTSSSNGTFTIDANDKMFDQHTGGMPDKADFEAALITMKEITVDLPQTYTAKPGTPLGNFTIRRILKTDGSKKIKKMKS